MSAINSHVDTSTDIPIIYSNSENDTIDTLSDEQVWTGLAESGLILLRGFNGGANFLAAAVNRFGSCQIPLAGIDIEMTKSGPVNRLTPNEQSPTHYHHGLNDIPMHRENFFRGLPQPDLMLFLCENPANKGGETKFCDGAKVWKLFDKKTVSFLNKHTLIGHWYELGATGMNDYDDVGDLNDSDVYAEYKTAAGENISRLSRVCQGIDAEFGIDKVGELFHSKFSFNPATSTSLFGRKDVWCNSVTIYASLQMTRARDAETAKKMPNVGVTTSDGKSVPETILDDIINCEEQATMRFSWNAGDLMIVDNTRVMHGRTAFKDTSRRLYNGAVYAPQSWIVNA